MVSDHVRGIDPANRGDSSITEGGVEICLNGVWGSVCDNGWDSLDAKVVCRQLNLMTHCELDINKQSSGLLPFTRCTYITYFLDARALYHYGGGSYSIHQAEIECTGRETHLTNCSTGHSSYCSHSTDVGVICPSSEQLYYCIVIPSYTPPPFVEPECNTTDIRLVSNLEEPDGIDKKNSTTEGRVEICLNGVWGTVCSIGWDRADAEVVCQQLNLSTHCECMQR